MGEHTSIQWAEATWNPWMGCTKVSPGCKHCYMYRDMERYGRDPFTVVRTKPPTFGAPLKWRQPKRIFTCSWSDWFHETADPWRAEAWAIVKCTPWHTYLILTKRADRIAGCLPTDWGARGYANVWLGVSVESQAYSPRIADLLAVPATVHFLSLEPLLGPLNIMSWLVPSMHVLWGNTDLPPSDRQRPTAADEHAVAQLGRAAFKMHGGRLVDWVIVGGESGPHFRPLELQWARDLRDQCVAAGVPYFFKQHAGVDPHVLGRELDGREWNDRP